MAIRAKTQGNGWNVASTSGLVPLAEPAFELPFVPGEVIAGKYEVIELVGVGGVGFVVAANHVELGEKVALKFLRPEMLERPDVVARFAQEASAAVRIKNEHVARVLDVGSLINGCPFIVMEYLEGRDLFDIVVNDGAQPVKRVVDYILQACEALADAHACGIIHRDIKPENLFLIQRSEGYALVKVLDFGISKVALTGSAVTSRVPLVRTMLPMGSPVYMSPEQIRAAKDVDARTDIWSLGCVLHELLTGKPAFDAPSLTQLSATILEEQPARPSELCPGVPQSLDTIVLRCLEKSPERRYQNIAELALALYPYGPRRARDSAERCCMLLKVDGANGGEFELPSVRPPGWDSLPSGAYPTTAYRELAVGRLDGLRHAPLPELSVKQTNLRARPLVAMAISAVLALGAGLLWAIQATPVPNNAPAPALVPANNPSAPTPRSASTPMGATKAPPSQPAGRESSPAQAIVGSTETAKPQAARAGLAPNPSRVAAPQSSRPGRPRKKPDGHTLSTDPDPGF